MTTAHAESGGRLGFWHHARSSYEKTGCNQPGCGKTDYGQIGYIPMRYALVPILAAVLAVLAIAPAALAQMPKELGGCWQTTKALQTSNVRSLTPVEANTFLGRKLLFSPALARSGGTSLQSPQYYVRKVAAADFADAFGIAFRDIGILEKSAVEIDIYREKNQLTEFPGNLVLIKNSQSILWNWRGVFFEASRCPTPNKTEARKH